MKKPLAETIAETRKRKGMTQAELAEKLGVTDKAVSKWERGLSCPDIGSLPRLAEVLDLSVEELMQIKKPDGKPEVEKKDIPGLILTGVGLAMGIAVGVLTVLDQLDLKSAVIMLAIGLACVALRLLGTDRSMGP